MGKSRPVDSEIDTHGKCVRVSPQPTLVFDPLHLRLGDVVMEFADDKSSRLIAQFDGGSYSHALMWVGGTDFVEATDGGARIVSFRRVVIQDPSRWALFRYIGSGEDSAGVAAAAAEEARKLAFVPYNLKGAITSITPAAKPTNAELFCSQLVAEAYLRAGSEAVPGRAPHKVTPKLLETSSAFQEVKMPVIVVASDAVPADYDRGTSFQASMMQREQKIAQRVVTELGPMFARLLPLPPELRWPISSLHELQQALAYGNAAGAHSLARRVHAIFEQDGYYTLITDDMWDAELVSAADADEIAIQGWRASLARAEQNAQVISRICKARPWPMWQALVILHTTNAAKFDLILKAALRRKSGQEAL